MTAWLEINLVVGGGWPPEHMNKLSLQEFSDWYAKAVEINKRQQDAMKAA